MFPIIGIVVVIGAILGGYLMEHGHLMVLFQPAELVIIGGAAIGTVLIGNSPSVLKSLFKEVLGVFKGSPYVKSFYIANLQSLYTIMQKARKNGLPSLEADVEEPSKSELFAKFPPGRPDHHVRDFVCDTLRTALSGAASPFELDQLMEVDIEVHHQYSHKPASALTTVADALPGLGIVAAVLGVVITMGALGGPPEEIGHKVAAALVGTFLGILLCYGFLGPIASRVSQAADEQGQYYHFLRIALNSFLKGSSPSIAVEFARRSIPGEVRPSFHEVEKACKATGKAAGAAA